MRLTQDQVRRLIALQRAFEKLIAGARSMKTDVPALRRRRGAELRAFQRQVSADLKQGMSVSIVAAKYGVTPAYVYRQRKLKPGKAKKIS